MFYVLLFGATMLLGVGMMAQMAAGMQSPEAMAGGFGLGVFLFYLVIYAIQFAQQLALTRLCSDRHRATIGEAITAGFLGVPTMFGAVLLLAIAGIGIGLVLAFVFAAVAMGAQSGGVMAVLVTLLIVAGVYLMARLCLLNPVVAIDEVKNPITVIARTWQLTAGHALKLVLVFAGVLIAALAVVATALFATIGIPAQGAMPSGSGVATFVVLMIAFGLTFGLYMVALMVAIHRQLAGTSAAAAEAFE